MILRSVPVLLLLALLVVAPASAQERAGDFPRVSPNAAVEQTVGVTDVSVTYGRPSARGRDLFGPDALEPYGEVWRTGANEATTITFSSDVMVEGEPLEAGTYGLFTVPGADEWTIIFNEQAEQWGAYNYDESRDVLRVQVDAEEAGFAEMLTIGFDEVGRDTAQMVIRWGEVAVPVTITVPTVDVVLERGDDAVAGSDDWQTPAQYAAWALQNELGLDKGLAWAETSIDRQSTFQNVAIRARILAAMERYDEAVQAGEQALAIARTMDEAPRGLDDFSAAVDEWRAQ